MSHFGNALAEARKKAGLTQSQLAAQVNVTRQALSHWENGRTLPEQKTKEMLAAYLDIDLSAIPEEDPDTYIPEDSEQPADGIDGDDIPPEEENAGEKAPEKSDGKPAEKPAKPAGGVWWKYVHAFLLGVFACLAIMLPIILSNQQVRYEVPVVTPLPPAENETLEWYRQASAVTPVAGQACLSILPNEDPIKVMDSKDFRDGKGWFYSLFINETGGIDFTVNEMVMNYFSNGKIAATDVISSQQFAEWYGSNVIPARGRIVHNGGMPVQDLDGIGVILSGADANGNALSFYGYVAFSQEPAN